MTRARAVLAALLGGAVIAVAALLSAGFAPARAADAAPPEGHVERVALATRAFRDATSVAGTAERREAFRRAAEHYDAALDAGHENGALEYNAGNAWFLAGDLGRAVLHYRRALRLRPGDARVQANLDIARTRRVDRFEETSGRALVDAIVFWHRGLSLRSKVPLALSAWVLGFLLLSVAAWLPRGARGRRGSWRTGWAAVLCAVAVGISAASDVAERAARDAAVVVGDEAALRTGDGWSYPERYENPIHSGTEVRIMALRAGWAEIELPDGKRGWVPVDAVERV